MSEAKQACIVPGGGGPVTPDDALVAAARLGDERAFDTLFARHYGQVVNLAFRLQGSMDDAEDIAQTAFIRAHANLKRLRDGQAILAWLYRTVVNLVRDKAKSARRKPLLRFGDLSRSGDNGGAEAYEGTPDSSFDPARIVEASHLQEALERAIAELPLEFREPLVLHHFQQVNVEQISEILGVPVGTVKSRLSRARGRLREALRPWFADVSERKSE